MNDMVTVTLSSQVYDRVERLAHERQQSVTEVLDDLTNQPGCHIERRPDVQGGDVCIAGTRVPVWVLAAMHKRGDTAEDILEAYPALGAASPRRAQLLLRPPRRDR
jgi:uncharacterized protein (DUF433 family)